MDKEKSTGLNRFVIVCKAYVAKTSLPKGSGNKLFYKTDEHKTLGKLRTWARDPPGAPNAPKGSEFKI